MYSNYWHKSTFARIIMKLASRLLVADEVMSESEEQADGAAPMLDYTLEHLMDMGPLFLHIRKSVLSMKDTSVHFPMSSFFDKQEANG